MEGQDNRLAIYLYSGIPVLQWEGEWCDEAWSCLMDAVRYLMGKAHFEMVVSFAKIRHTPLLELAWWRNLEKLYEVVISRHGRVEFVGSMELARTAAAVSRTRHHWVLAEEEAVCHIQGLSRCAHSVVVRGRLGELSPNHPPYAAPHVAQQLGGGVVASEPSYQQIKTEDALYEK